MFETEITLCRFHLGMVHPSVDDLEAEEMMMRPASRGNPPVWLLGHLALCADYAIQCLGDEGNCSPEWHENFGPGSQPLENKHPYPGKTELLESIDHGYAEALRLAAEADAEAMRQPHSVELLKGTGIETVGELVAHLLTTHFAFHLGQLSTWRRIHGRPALF